MPNVQGALTPKQDEILRFIKQYIKDQGYPPACIDIQTAMGFRSPNAVSSHLERLEAKGAIERTPKIARGIRLTKKRFNVVPWSEKHSQAEA